MKKIPKLRFPEFSGEWEEKKYDIKIISGNTYPLNTYRDNGKLLVQGLNIYPGKLILDNPIYISNEYNDLKHQLIEKNDILIGLNRPIVNNEVKVCQFDREVAYLYQRAGILKFEEKSIEKRYFYQYLRTSIFKKGLENELVGSDQPYIKSDLFKKLNIFFPIFEEQEKIASFLSKVDESIEILEEEKELWEKYKKGIMQKIFSKKLRFKDENGNNYPEWEEKRIKELPIKISDGNYGELYPRADELLNEGIPFIRANNLKNLKIVWNDMRYISIQQHNILLSGHLKTNDILVSTRGNIGTLAFVDKEFDNSNINAQLCLLRVYNPGVIIPKYLLNFLSWENTQKQFSQLQTGTALKQLPKKKLEIIILKIPTLPEQEKIANFLSSIDEKIETVEEELELVKELKKGFLQKMFV